MKNLTYILFAIMILFMASCSSDSEAILESSTIERIDIVLDGTDKEYIYLESDEIAGENDLVEYNLSNIANEVDFIIHIDDQRTLVFKVYNEIVAQPWSYVQEYSIYPSQNLEDKSYYVTAELRNGGEIAAFKSHVFGSYPQGIILNTFRVESYNPETGEVLCRIVGLPMQATSLASDEEISISGTFRGIVNI